MSEINKLNLLFNDKNPAIHLKPSLFFFLAQTLRNRQSDDPLNAPGFKSDYVSLNPFK